MTRNQTSDIGGLRFGKLIALDCGREAGKLRWICRCDCGNVAFARPDRLANGQQHACKECSKEGKGALISRAVTKHGGASRGGCTKEYRAWASMIRRCEYPSQRTYKNYGGRGITVCAEWRCDFSAFLRDVGLAPSDKHTVDRVDTNGNYEPGNVRWATRREQDLNRRNTVRIVVDGESMTIIEAAERAGVCYQTMRSRVQRHPEQYDGGAR